MKLRKPAAPARATRRVRRMQEVRDEAPATLSMRGLLLIFGVAAAASALGAVQVQERFRQRDFEIEARRMQDLAAARHDELKRLEASVGILKSDANLREAAISAFGMTEPPTQIVGELTIDPQRTRQIARAARKAQDALANTGQAPRGARKEASF